MLRTVAKSAQHCILRVRIIFKKDANQMYITPIKPTGSEHVSAMRVSGTVYFLRDLPPPDTVRWVISRKTLVAAAVISGLLTEEAVLERYPDLTLGELQHWVKMAKDGNIKELRVTRLSSNAVESQTLMELSESFSITVGDVTVCSSGGTVTCGAGGEEVSVHLTELEMRILGYLMLNAGSVVQRSALIKYLYKGKQKEPEIKLFDVIVCKLRKKIKIAFGKKLIKTEWGRGYCVPAAT